MPGASWLHVSQSTQVESTKKSPGTFSGKRCCRLAITSQYKVPGKGFSRKGTKLKIKAQRLTSFFFVPWLLTLCLCVKPYSEVKLIDESMQVRTTDPELLRGRESTRQFPGRRDPACKRPSESRRLRCPADNATRHRRTQP